MNNEWLQIQTNNGVCEIEDHIEHDPDMTEIRNDYRWTPQCQRAFLEALAFGGSVLRAAKAERNAWCWMEGANPDAEIEA
jgi:hypothetical protein